MEGKVCSKCGVWKLLEEFNKCKKNKDGRQFRCRECEKQRWLEERPRKVKEVREGMKKCSECGVWKPLEEYHKKKDGKHSACKKCRNKQMKKYNKNNAEQIKERKKQRYQNNKEHIKEQSKQRYRNNKQNNLQYISNIVEQTNPTFKQLNLPIYGYIYRFKNIKTGHNYIGQTTKPLKERYKSNVIQGWIEERKGKINQKFKEELIEKDIVVTEALDVAFCQYHLDKLEAYYIDKYDSFLNGYNNQAGNYKTDDYIEEFNQILLENNLEFIDGKLVKIA